MAVVTCLLLSFVGFVGAEDSENPFTPANIKNSELIAKKRKAGLAPETKNDSKFNQDTLLVFAVRNGAVDTVEVVLKAGAAVDRRTPGFSKTALFQAAYGGNVAVARVLSKHGANPNAVDEPGNNALREAIVGKNPAMVAYLLEAGCNPLQTNESKESMINLAEKYGTPEIKRLMKEKKRSPDKVL